MTLGSHIKYYTIIICALLSLSYNGMAQAPSFTASLNSRQVSIGEAVELTFTIGNATAKQFTQPSLGGLKVMSGPNEFSNTTVVNGKISSSVGISYTLVAIKPGSYIIGAARCIVGGKPMQTQAMNLVVSSAPPSSRQDAADVGKDVFIKAIVNKSTATIGEQILLDYKLYTRTDIMNKSLISESEYRGFFAQVLERYDRQVIETINGRQFMTQVLKRVALFPQQTGTFEITPIYIAADMMQGLGFPKSTELRSNALSIKVNPLPSDAPATFCGAVGDYTCSSSINRNSLSTDDALVLRLIIKGNGDMKRITAPTLNLGDAFEVYPPQLLDERMEELDGQVMSAKEWEYQLLPKQVGAFEIKPTFTYWDDVKKSYVNLQPEQYRVNVTQGTGANKDKNQQAVRWVIKDVRSALGAQAIRSKFWGSGWFYTLYIMPLLGIVGVLAYQWFAQQQLNIDIAVLKRRKAKSVAQKRLSTAKQYMDSGDERRFYNEISKAIQGYVADKCNVPAASMNKADVRQHLSNIGTNEGNIESCLQLLLHCEQVLFSGGQGSADMASSYQATAKWIDGMEA